MRILGLIACVLALSVYFFKFLPLNCYVVLAIQLTVGAAVFFAVCEGWKREEYLELKGIVKRYKEKIKK